MFVARGLRSKDVNSTKVNDIMRILILVLSLLGSAFNGLAGAEENLVGDFKSAEINAEIKKLPELAKTLQTLMEARMKTERAALIEKLKTYQTTATKAGDLDEALKVRAAIAQLETLQEAKETFAGKTDEPKTAKPNIPKNAIKFGDSSYFVIKKPMSWSDAKKFCEEQGGHLARIESRETALMTGLTTPWSVSRMMSTIPSLCDAVRIAKLWEQLGFTTWFLITFALPSARPGTQKTQEAL
jgi:hypothetical protein